MQSARELNAVVRFLQTNRRALVAVGLTLVLSACVDQPLAPETTTRNVLSESRGPQSSVASVRGISTPDDRWREVARRSHAFAGITVDSDGAMVVHLTRIAQYASVEKLSEKS